MEGYDLIGSIWKDRDPRSVRYVKVVSFNGVRHPNYGVVRVDPDGKRVPGSRFSQVLEQRFFKAYELVKNADETEPAPADV